MQLHQRAMQPGDVQECVAIVVSHANVASRYGNKLAYLKNAWLELFSSLAKCSAVIVHENGSCHPPVCFFCVSVFVKDDFVREVKGLPQFWVGPELVERILGGRSPVLSDSELRQANSQGGMNLVVWEGLARRDYETFPILHRMIMKGFIESHQGYLWRELVAAQSESGERLTFTLRTGGWLWNPLDGCYTPTSTINPDEVIKEPHIVGVTPEMEFNRQDKWTGSWLGALFDYHPPILSLSEKEQRLLTHALPGATDEDLAKILEVSMSSVKQMWFSIYARAEDLLPHSISEAIRSAFPESGRGKEKRRRLLGYIREHPEELRPIIRKRRINCG